VCRAGELSGHHWGPKDCMVEQSLGIVQSLGSSGLETDGSCQAGRLTVCRDGELSGHHWGPKGCMVEQFLGSGGLRIGGAGLGSGWGTSTLGEEP